MTSFTDIVNDNNNLPQTPAAVNRTATESDCLEARMLAIFHLLADAKGFIDSIECQEAEIKLVHKKYCKLACKIGAISSKDKIERIRLAHLAEKIDQLPTNPLGINDLEPIYNSLKGLCNQQIKCLYDSGLVMADSTAPASRQATSLSKFVATMKGGSCFLGLLDDTQLGQLSPTCYKFLNDRIRIEFEKTLAIINGLSFKRPTCFICYNTEEQEVKNWLGPVLVRDLGSIGVCPIWSGDDLSPGMDLITFEMNSIACDFAIVICTPDLHAKYTLDKNAYPLRNKNWSGVTSEIEYIKAWSKPMATIPILFKARVGKKSNDVNPFKEGNNVPFGVSPTQTNYSEILKLFVALKIGDSIGSRKIAEQYISELRAQSEVFLNECLSLQQEDPEFRCLSKVPCVMMPQDIGLSDEEKRRLNSEIEIQLPKSRTIEQAFQQIRKTSRGWNLHGDVRSAFKRYMRHRKAEIHYQSGEIKEAISTYRGIIGRYREDHDAQYRLIRLYHLSKEFKEVDDHFYSSFSNSNTHACEWMELGNCFLQQERHLEAIHCFEKVRVDDKTHLTYFHIDCQVLPEEFRQIVQSTGQLSVPVNLFAQYLLVKAYLKTNQIDQARECCKRVRCLAALSEQPEALIQTLMGWLDLHPVLKE